MSGIHLWLREEVKEHEKRTALTPENCKKLLAKGSLYVCTTPFGAASTQSYESLK